MLEIRALGQFELRLNGVAVLLPSRPTQSLLAYLALTAGTAHRREKLAGMLWPDAEDDNARNSLRHALWRIRKAIEPDELATPYLLTDDLAVTFNAGADYWLDVAQLARGGDTLQELGDSVRVYRGELLPGFYDDWVSLERERLDSVFQHKMQRLLDGLLGERRWPEVLEWGECWVALGHAPEPGYRALMRAHAELGDRARMAAVYQRCREALFNDLGVEPSVQTRQLYERLRQDDVQIGPPPRAITIDDAPAPGVPPFQGLHYFDEADADRFFGRERLSQQLLSRIRQEHFLAVIGASGSGKSSVVRAGLVPALRRASRVCVLTPTARPLQALAVAVERPPSLALRELTRDAHGLKRLLRASGAADVVLVVDQFEELFTLCDEPFEREALVDNLLGATEDGSNVRVVIALRADFYAQCGDFPSLRRAIGSHQEYVGPLDAAELRRAIEAPAAHGGWELQQGLVELLLRDVGDEPGALPLLSHALLETWHRRKGRLLSLAGYTASGGVHGAIAQTAETVYRQRLSASQQSIARRVFLQLTELGEGTQDTRRRATLDELIRVPAEEADVRAVLRTLAEARLIALGDATAEVAHEALIREWSRLREWLNQDRADLRVHRQLSLAAREWRRLGEDSGSLYRGARLTQAVEWAAAHTEDLNPQENAFLQASRDEAESEAADREAQRRREVEAARQLAEAEQRRAD
ncbi:MAG: hypothetical protein JO352_08280, partial [Chloroflexi bacterium]|nr:hypothetical protein [Chloroflexota bacterium]